MKKLIFGIVLLVCECSFAIVGGRTITDGSYRQSVALVFKKSESQPTGEVYCSGTLIGPRVVITAAHCLRIGAQFFQVALGEFQKKTWIYIGDSPDESSKPLAVPQFPTVRAIFFPQSDWVMGDIALLELAEDVDLTAFNIQPAPVTLADDRMMGRELTHVGFGVTEEKGAKGTKAAMTLPLQRWNGYNGLGVGEPRESGPSACHGDSGGSAYILDEDGATKFIGVEYSISNYPCGKSATYFIPISTRLLQWIKDAGLPIFEQPKM